MKNRIAIYTFFDKKGVVHSFVLTYLTALKCVTSKIIVVVNGTITPDSLDKLNKLGCAIVIRENHGFDFGAWKAGINFLTWEVVKKCDELILCNCSCYGPFGTSFESIFDYMDNKNQALPPNQKFDFWGITKHLKINSNFLPDDKSTIINEHIQSYFLVFKNTVIKSNAFYKYWQELTEYDEFDKEVVYHEAQFTKYLADANFLYSTYVDCEKYQSYLEGQNISYLDALNLIQNNSLPLIKRKLFLEYDYFFSKNLASISRCVFEYITKQSPSFADEIWEDLLERAPMSQIKKALALNYILPGDVEIPSPKKLDNKASICCICFVFYQDLVDSMLQFLKQLPSETTIYLVSSNSRTLEIYKQKIESHDSDMNYHQNIKYRIQPNQGRDLAAYLVTCKDVFDSHDYICCIHDKKSSQLKCESASHDFAYHCLDNCLHSQEYVQNIINTFEKNPKLGLLVPPTIYFGIFGKLGNELNAVNKSNYENLYNLLKIHVPIDLEPVAPLGSMFWIRAQATKTLFSYNWNYNDFAKEPMALDGTISHALERFIPMTVQNDGYYTAWCCSDNYSAFYLNNLSNTQRKTNMKLFQLFGGLGPYDLTESFSKYSFNNQSSNNQSLNKKILTNQSIKRKIIKYKILVILSLGLIHKWKTRLKTLKAKLY